MLLLQRQHARLDAVLWRTLYKHTAHMCHDNTVHGCRLKERVVMLQALVDSPEEAESGDVLQLRRPAAPVGRPCIESSRYAVCTGLLNYFMLCCCCSLEKITQMSVACHRLMPVPALLRLKGAW